MKKKLLFLFFSLQLAFLPKMFSEETSCGNTFHYIKSGIGLLNAEGEPIPEVSLGIGSRTYTHYFGLDSSVFLSTLFTTLGVNVSEMLLYYPGGVQNHLYLGAGLGATVYTSLREKYFSPLLGFGNFALGWQYQTAKARDRFIQLELGVPFMETNFKSVEWITDNYKDHFIQTKLTFGF